MRSGRALLFGDGLDSECLSWMREAEQQGEREAAGIWSREELVFLAQEPGELAQKVGHQKLRNVVFFPNHEFHGEVVSVDTRVDPVSRTIAVRAVLPNEHDQLRPGMFLTVSLLRKDVNALLIPEEAIVPERSKQFVYVLDENNVVSMREVQVGRRRPGEVEILNGLSDGNRVITEGTQKVRVGQAVVPVPKVVAAEG